MWLCSMAWHIIRLYSPTPDQCEEVTSQLKKNNKHAGKEWSIFLFAASPESATCHDGHS